ncbi:MAG: glycoside hydrolase family 3 C-terminal domain-containing protein [Steroidobacteraceae bacterium]
MVSRVAWVCVMLSLAGAHANAGENMPTSGAAIEARVESLMAQMTLQEKIGLISGSANMRTGSLPRLGIPALYTSDGPLGARLATPSTAYAAGISLAATWDTELAREVGHQIGRDARSRGANFLLGPGVNIYRAPMNGRNFEYFGEDPFLAARITVNYVEGVQSQRVSATVKHYMANNSEYARHTSDSVIDERTMREIYLPVFEAAVKQAHVGAVMSSYNLTNGEHMSQNAYLDNEVLKHQWGFDGLLISDWGSTYDGIAAANAGLDLEMPRGLFMNPNVLLPAIDSGAVLPATIDDKVRRLLRLAVRFGWLDKAQMDIDIPRYNQAGRSLSLRAAEEGMVLLKNEQYALPLDKTRIRTIALIGPDAHPGMATAGGSGHVQTFAAASPLTALSDFMGLDGRVLYHRGLRTMQQLAHATVFTTTRDGNARGITVETYSNDQLSGTPVSTRVLPTATVEQPRLIETGGEEQGPDFNYIPGAAPAAPEARAAAASMSMRTEATSMRITGYFKPSRTGRYILAVRESHRFRLLVDDQVVIDESMVLKAALSHVVVALSTEPHTIIIEHFHSATDETQNDFIQCGVVAEDEAVNPAAKAMAAKAEVAIVAVGFDEVSESEGQDREFDLPPGQEELIREVAAANKHTIVIVTSGGSVATAQWLERVPAVIQGWYAGEEGGTALIQLLFGQTNFSGRLPISWEQDLRDNPCFPNYYYQDPLTQKITYAEGVFVGYRGYERNHVRPLFPFGFGLSYTTFHYSHIEVRPIGHQAGAEPHFDVSFEVTNTGKLAGADVGQVYVSDDTHPAVERPAKELKGFARVYLKPGEQRRVHVELNARSFAYYDVQSKAWHANAGRYRILVGRSSTEIVLTHDLMLPLSVSVPASL